MSKEAFKFLGVEPRFKLEGEVQLIPTFQIGYNEETDEIYPKKVPCTTTTGQKDIAKIKKGKVVWVKLFY